MKVAVERCTGEHDAEFDIDQGDLEKHDHLLKEKAQAEAKRRGFDLSERCGQCHDTRHRVVVLDENGNFDPEGF